MLSSSFDFKKYKGLAALNPVERAMRTQAQRLYLWRTSLVFVRLAANYNQITVDRNYNCPPRLSKRKKEKEMKEKRKLLKIPGFWSKNV